ncbi:MAG: hypothetical protein J6C29_00875 [Clostridia bacterium]|nr:hypothetical protein [Clostridia bacterium]
MIKTFFKNLCKHNFKLNGIVALLVCICIVISISACGANEDTAQQSSLNITSIQSEQLYSSEAEQVSSDISSEISSALSSEAEQTTTTSSSKVQTSTSSKKQSTNKTSSKATTTSTKKPSNKGEYQYNTNLNIEDNVFMDSLIYTGYNMKKHRADGKMWTYVLAKYKRGYGWLSNITYAGGSTGLETKNGKPDIKAFERGGFVCASFATYVYFNYLPNVAGIDTSSLPRPENTKLADSWYKAVQKWVKKGYSRKIDFTASVDSNRYIVFKPKEEIPIGSIIIFSTYATRNSKNRTGSHVVVYAGYKNGNHWVYHVGTKNGPEMCAVERMLYGPEAQWPLMVVTTPKNIRMAAMLEVELKDDSGKAISGVSFSLKSKETGKTVTLGKTDKNGKLTKECLNYGEYTLVQTSVANGYTVSTKNTPIKLTTKNNSKNTVKIVNTKNKPVVTSSPSSTVSKEEGASSDNTISK